MDLNRVHFFLLGNRPESLYLPSAIVIVEGKCDHIYIERVISLALPKTRISVIQANSDNRVADVFHIARDIFGDVQKSPYRERIFAILDSVHTSGMRQKLIGMGMPEASVIVWEKNGIEYYYPRSALEEIFHSPDEISICEDRVSLNGLDYNENVLCNLVVAKITASTVYPEEFCDKFLNVLKAAVE